MSGGCYAAFLSYSQADEALATWLQRGLEGFRIPDALVGYEGPNGPIGKRLGEVYLHNVENGLGGEARAALERSDALVVLRPAEAARLDARDEVRHFAGLGRTRIVSAVTGAAPRGAQPIVWRKLVDEGAEPAAREGGAVVDFRSDTKAQRDGAKLKLIATLLDVDIEELEEPPAPPLKMPAMPKLPPAPKLPSMPSLPRISPHAAGVAAGAMAVLLVVGGAAWFVSNLPPRAPPAQIATVEAETQVALAEPEAAPPAVPLSPPELAPPEVVAPTPVATPAAPPAVAPPRPQPPMQVATPRPQPQPAPATRPPSQVAAVAPPPAPAQVAAAPPRETPPPVQQSAPPAQTAAARPAVETVSLASLSAQLRELGAAHSVAIRCLGRSSQESRLRARHLIASSPEPNRGDLIRAFNEGYTAAETRAGECPGGVQPTSG